jgi:8-oxo-dGTP pyrophosphatase MutT (NUDIX family)
VNLSDFIERFDRRTVTREGLRMLQKRVVVAMVQDSQGWFLVHYNSRWGGYSFSMADLEEGADVLGSAAIRALEDDLGYKLPNARAQELEYLRRGGRSSRTGEETLYEYWLYQVDPGQPLDLSVASQGNSNPPLFVSFGKLTNRTDLTWSAVDIIRELVETQEAVLTVVPRPGEHQTEFLVTWNENYGGYFFPTQRIKTENKPDTVARATVRSDLGYRGPVHPVWRGEVPNVHFSNRFQRDRQFRFHVCEVELPEVDLHQPSGILEQALNRRQIRFLWVGADRLGDPSIPFSPTMAAVASAVRSLIPPQTIPPFLRQSEGGIALCERTLTGQREWLAQWNDNWKAFFFVGGHRHSDETFRDCVVREIQEELGLGSWDFEVAPKPAHQLQYRAQSRSANELTAYHMELFEAQIVPGALEHVEGDSRNGWLTEEEIRRLEAYDARPISVTMLMLLSLAGRMAAV